MTRVKPIMGSQGHQKSQSQSDFNSRLKAAKMTMSVAAKNQAENNDRWQNTLQSYQHFMVRH